MIKITIGITIYNRKKTLERMIASLYASNLKEAGMDYFIRVYDDCSDEFSEEDIRKMFPENIEYFRHERNQGSDYNIGFMYRHFLETGDDVLFNCDSDLMFEKKWLNEGLKYLKETDGILSLFNTKSHEIKELRDELCVKDTIGSAGTLMTREAVEIICSHIDESQTKVALDHNWCSLYRSLGRKIYSTRKSYVQHIGINGFNSSSTAMDIGENFEVDSIVNGRILGDVLHDVIAQRNTVSEKKKGLFFLFPFDRIRPGKSVVIYGLGEVGQDYRKQLESIDYCKEIILVDKNYKNLSGVENPKILKSISCDYVLIAAHFDSVRKEMRKTILEFNPQLEEKLIDDACNPIRIN